MTPDLRQYRWIVVNSSAGKDSQTMLHQVCTMARAADVLGRVVVVHADLGEMEWPGTHNLARQQAGVYGVRFEVVRREQGDLLTHITVRGKWPGPSTRYCTSDHKRGQIGRLFTQLGAEAEGPILNCLGMRAEESPARAKLEPFTLNTRYSNTRREVFNWLPIHAWELADVWKSIRTTGVPYHYAYDLGMPRLSCVFCVYAPKAALMLAGKHNPELLARYVEVEKRIGHRFRKELSLEEVAAALEAGELAEAVADWRM